MKDVAVAPIVLLDPDRQRRLIEGMIARVAASRTDHLRLRDQCLQDAVTLEQQLAKQLAEVKANCFASRRDTLLQWDEAQETAIAAYEAATMATQEDLRRITAKYRRKQQAHEATINNKVDKRTIAVNDQYEARKNGPPKQRASEHHLITETLAAGDSDYKWSQDLTMRRLDRLLEVDFPADIFAEFQEVKPTSVRDAIDLILRLNRRLNVATIDMQTGFASKVVDSFYLPAGVAVFIVIWVFTALVMKADPLLMWMIASVPAAGVLGFSIYLLLLWPLKRMTRRLHPLCERIRRAAEVAASVGKSISTALADESSKELLTRRETHLSEAKRWQTEQIELIRQKIATESAAERSVLQSRLQSIQNQFNEGFAKLQKTMRERADQTASSITQTLTETDQFVGQSRQEVLAQHQMTLESLAYRLKTGLSRGARRIESTTTATEQRFPAWFELLKPIAAVPNLNSQVGSQNESVDYLPIGSLRLGHRLKHRLDEAIGEHMATSNGESNHAPQHNGQVPSNEVADATEPITLLRDLEIPESVPLVLHRRRHCGVIIEVPPQNLDDGVAIAHQLLWRLLTAAPPGRANLTLIDPAGRGQNFASFMALADHDPAIIGHRVWTTGDKITQRLAELTHHVEDVLQSSLRDRFERVEDYNAVAGSLAQPYHAVAAVGFPEALSREAYSHLNSLIHAGLRCGVFVILVLEKGKPWPSDMPRPQSNRLLHLSYELPDEESNDGDYAMNAAYVDGRESYEITKNAARLTSDSPILIQSKRLKAARDGYSMGQWRCLTAGLQQWELRPFQPPSPEVREPLVRRIGTAAVAAARVVVPLASLWPDSRLPEGNETHSTRSAIDITIGSQGAGRTLALKLGQGVRQHVLIAGKTGSGKSTLLHSIITSGAAAYRPDELLFYLLDFKKGVEFKIYADENLPHARIIGIESEREFGRSVLQRLDAELATRGEQFRAAGVGELDEFRGARPDVTMPRIMLVIDEFQELFTRDDVLASDCTSLLDRLVRQGRSFGIHVVLSSQSLAGANSLPRATLGQMAVRVAMMCGESDAALILADDNTAARLLTRPGEAIYNDAGGLLEGNHPFQVAWLGPNEHRELLNRITTRDQDLVDDLGASIIFEGNRPGQFTATAARESLRLAHTSDAIVGLLGESIQIGPPTTLQLSATTGRNVLLVAPPRLRAGVLSSIIATALAHRPGLSITLIDGARSEDGPTTSAWCTECGIEAKIVRPRESDTAVIELAAEVQSRVASDKSGLTDGGQEVQLLIVDSLDRLRDLRQEDQFAFSLDATSKISAAASLQSILRDGPGVNVFTILTIPSAETLSRWLPRQSHHDLEVRLIGPINAADSSLLIDTPIASELSTATMILYDESNGQLTKFRLCDPPTQEEIAKLNV